MQGARRLETRARRNHKAFPVMALHIHTEALEQLQGDVDVRFGYEFAHHF